MRILITGVCGFVGSELATQLSQRIEGLTLLGVDNLIRPGSEINRNRLKKLRVEFTHCDVRAAADLEGLPGVDWVIDAAAQPSVASGIDGQISSRQLMEHNLLGSVNVLEYCKSRKAGLVLLSSSRVFSIHALDVLPLTVECRAFTLDGSKPLPLGISVRGIGVECSTKPPVSLYGSTKLASEMIALEYGTAFDIPVWINRCGILAGARQFGTAGQGILSYWLNAHAGKRPLRYSGFGGNGYQVRDALHPADLGELLVAQMRSGRHDGQRIYTLGGGTKNAISLSQLTTWCDERFGSHVPTPDPDPRPYDVPWVIMDTVDAERDFGWRPSIPLPDILGEIADHAVRHPNWLDYCGV